MKKDMVELPKRTLIVCGKYVYYTESVNYVKEQKVSRTKRILTGIMLWFSSKISWKWRMLKSKYTFL